MPRNHKIEINVTADELALIQATAAAKGLPVASFIRSAALAMAKKDAA